VVRAADETVAKPDVAAGTVEVTSTTVVDETDEDEDVEVVICATLEDVVDCMDVDDVVRTGVVLDVVTTGVNMEVDEVVGGGGLEVEVVDVVGAWVTFVDVVWGGGGGLLVVCCCAVVDVVVSSPSPPDPCGSPGGQVLAPEENAPFTLK
jgi:hypothetical protein